MHMLYKSEAVDTAISALEMKMRRERKHLIKTESIIKFVRENFIDLADDLQEREELLQAGIKQVIQSRLNARGYFSITTGYFVNVEECENLVYLQMIVKNKDDVISVRIKARNRFLELKGKAGTMEFVPDEQNFLQAVEYKPLEELLKNIEEDAV